MGRRKSVKDLESYIEDVTENVSNDRAMALNLLTKMMKDINSSHDHKDLGLIAAKYLETLQRSNEQLVKISALVHKRNSGPDALSEIDKSEIYEMIKEDTEE
jgi:hypothetical protein|tara:strand:+ start:1215 stop:1520 length:306 start_codon:yes stop_codon:yes gene_type:complete